MPNDDMNQEIATREDFSSVRNPELLMKEAEQVAAAFRRRAESLQLYKQIGSSKHLLIEGWQMLASMYRVTASVESTRFVQFGEASGWEATAVAKHIPTGHEISRADAMCLSDEDNWGPRTKYEYVDGKKEKVGSVPTPTQQLRSMAQTRSCSKVLSNLFKFVARIAGFAGTPAEEMTGNEPQDDFAPRGPVQQPQRKGGVISEAQAKRFFAIGKTAGRTEDEIRALLTQYGFEKSADITKDKYDAICADVQKPQTAAPPSSAPSSSDKKHPFVEAIDELRKKHGRAVDNILGNLGYSEPSEVLSARQGEVLLELSKQLGI